MGARACVFLGLLLAATAVCANDDIFDLSIDQLMNVPIETASKVITTVAESSSSVIVVTQQDIRAYGWSSLNDVLNAQPGFFSFSDRIYDFVSVRGIYHSNDPNSRILLLINGHSVIENFGYFNGQLAAMDLSHVKQIEIVRGPGSTLYGTNAMHAVINIITHSYSDLQTFVKLSFGDYERKSVSAQLTQKLTDNASIVFSYDGLEGDKQSLYFDEYANAGYPNGGFSPELANELEHNNYFIKIDLNNWTLQYFDNYRKKRVPTGIYGGAFADTGTFFADSNRFFEAKYQYKVGKAKLYSRLFYDEYQFHGRFKYTVDPNWENGPPYASEFNAIDEDSAGFETVANLKWSQQHATLLGFEYKRFGDLKFAYYSENDPDQSLNENYSIDESEHVASLFWSHQWQALNDWTVEIGARYDDYSAVGNHLSWRAATGYQINPDHKIKAIFAEAFRAPNLWSQNGGFFLSGNPDLQPETLETIELLWDGKLSSYLLVNASIYSTLSDNTISQGDSGAFENVAGVKAQGADIKFTLGSQSYDGYLSASYAKSKQRRDSEPLSFSPAWMLKSGVVCKRCWANMDIAMELQHIGPRYYANAQRGQMASYTLINANFNYLLTPALYLNFKINNVFDKAYQHPAFSADLASFYRNVDYPVYDIPANGREWIVSIKVDF